MVAAVNRLDGRQYAVKKIRMPSSAPVAYSRLMREVSTLARLQHPHVVRYFQVCTLGIPAEPSALASVQPHLCYHTDVPHHGITIIRLEMESLVGTA